MQFSILLLLPMFRALRLQMSSASPMEAVSVSVYRVFDILSDITSRLCLYHMFCTLLSKPYSVSLNFILKSGIPAFVKAVPNACSSQVKCHCIGSYGDHSIIH